MALPNYSIAIKRAQTQEATLALSAIYQAQIGYSHSHGGNYAESLQDLSIGVGPFQTFKNLVVANADVVSCQGNREFFLASLTAKDDSFELYLLEDGRIVCAPCESSLCEKLGYPLW